MTNPVWPKEIISQTEYGRVITEFEGFSFVTPNPTQMKEDKMTITPVKYTRIPFLVEGVQVTEENMSAVAEWCKGEVRIADGEKPGQLKFIKVRVHQPLTPKQTQAFVGDWVLLHKGFKVFTDKAFKASYREAAPVSNPADRPATVVNVYAPSES